MQTTNAIPAQESFKEPESKQEQPKGREALKKQTGGCHRVETGEEREEKGERFSGFFADKREYQSQIFQGGTLQS